MKRIGIIVVFLMFFVYINNTYAQGYKGKRFAAGYEMGFSLLERNILLNRTTLVRHSAEINYALSRRFSFGFRANYAKKTLPAGYRSSTLGQNSYLTLGILNDIARLNFTNAMIEDFTVGISVRYFAKSNGCYAPIGKYFGVGYEIGRQNGTTLLNTVQNPENSWSTTNYYAYDRNNRQTLMLFSFTYGRNILFKENFLFGYGITMSFSKNRIEQFRRHIGRPFVNIAYVF